MERRLMGLVTSFNLASMSLSLLEIIKVLCSPTICLRMPTTPSMLAGMPGTVEGGGRDCSKVFISSHGGVVGGLEQGDLGHIHWRERNAHAPTHRERRQLLLQGSHLLRVGEEP